MKQARWQNDSYQRIRGAKFSENTVIVHFDNEDVIEVPVEKLLNFGLTDMQWGMISYNPYELIIPAQPHSLEVPWDKLRVLTDKEFGKYRAEISEEQSKLIGIKIKRLREKNGLKSNELADRAGITPQTISRIEQGHTDVSFVTLRKILAAMGYSLRDLANQELELELEAPTKTFGFLMKRLNKAGIDSNLLTRKIIPHKIQVALNQYRDTQPSLLLDEVASYISNIYGWKPSEIWGNQALAINSTPSALAYFKKPDNANVNQIKAYSHYAYYLAKVLLKAFPNKVENDYPGSLEDFNDSYTKKYKTLELKSLLDFVWNLGICVLPLSDSGVFHGASWNIEGKHVIVLKQNTKAHSRWIFDLLHELYHVFAHLDKENTSVVEVEELNPFSNNDSIEELEANSFANQVIFGDKAEELADQCVTSAKWDLKNLSNAVVKVAKKESIREDFLSNYLAFRLSNQGENWWGTASKLQIVNPDPFDIAANFLKDKIQMQKLSPIDYSLLNTAITK